MAAPAGPVSPGGPTGIPPAVQQDLAKLALPPTLLQTQLAAFLGLVRGK